MQGILSISTFPNSRAFGPVLYKEKSTEHTSGAIG